jgi:CubicO group peptidase (beta-lactamase class C family)
LTPRLRVAYDDQAAVFVHAFDVLQRAVETRAFPGGSLAVAQGGQLVALHAVGRFTYDPASPAVTSETIFDLASVSKVVATTAMAMLLYDRGRLDLNAPVAAVVPEFARGDDPRRSRVSWRMLLAHASGLPAYERLFERSATREELLAAAMHPFLTADPGTRAEYSDLGFIVLGEGLQRVAGESLDSFCTREVFAPLAMEHTCFCPAAEVRPQIPPTADDRTFRRRIVQGEVQDENAWVLGGVAGHAGVFSTAADVARFAQCVLEGGRPLVRPETVEMFTRRQEMPPGSSRALGWDTPSPPSQSGQYFSSRSYGHLGYTGTSLWVDPDRQLSATLLTNRTWPDCKNQQIKQVRPLLHNELLAALGGGRV